jgi:uracil phosphoribosyltransferase
LAYQQNNKVSIVHKLSDQKSAANLFMRQLRDVNTQVSKEHFRRNIEKIGQIIGYEISKELTYKTIDINTPLALHKQEVLQDDIVIVTILRAGLPLHNGILEVFPEAENGFISAYRKHDETGAFEIEVEYVACPDITDKILILNDPMLATGGSFVTAWNALLELGKPKAVHIAAVIASSEGVQYVRDNAPMEFDLWVADIDDQLNDSKYIVPGLGDAGDLAFGPKAQS